MSSSDIVCSFASRALSTPSAMSADCSSIVVITPHVSASNPYFPLVYPISRTVSRTIFGMSTYAFVVISPMTMTIPVVQHVSHATQLMGSCSISASRIASEIWSHILSGCPSVTDSDVNNNFSITSSPFLCSGASLSSGRPVQLSLSDRSVGAQCTVNALFQRKTARTSGLSIYRNNPLIVRSLAQVGTFLVKGLPQLLRSFVSPLL